MTTETPTQSQQIIDVLKPIIAALPKDAPTIRFDDGLSSVSLKIESSGAEQIFNCSVLDNPDTTQERLVQWAQRKVANLLATHAVITNPPEKTKGRNRK